MPVLEPDSSLRLPNLTVLKASAGSGKTFALTERFVQFLLSERIAHNDLRNLLAITFSNNAAREMREKVLEWLKRLSFGDPERLAEISSLTQGTVERIAERAGSLMEEILSRYSDFQVRTIDSFMSMVFRASAIDFGFNPEFEIVMETEAVMDYAFNLFLREAREGTERAALLDATVETVLGLKGSEDAWPWDPATPLLAETKKVESTLSARDERPRSADLGPRLREAEAGVRRALERVAVLVDASGLDRRVNSPFPVLLASARAGRISDLVKKPMRKSPVNKPSGKNTDALARWEEVQSAWGEVNRRVDEYAGWWARAYYQPYVRLHEGFTDTLEKVKRSQGKVFIGDIGRFLGAYIENDIVPDIYFRIGERVWHFLVDEFQDTSPIQWRNLRPLVENSLAMGGSLFVVGDTKQAIYGFRQADYTIMKALEAGSPFPSAGHTLRELSTNWRSTPRVLELAAKVFKENAVAADGYRDAARRSGLDAWDQVSRPGNDPGYAEVQILPRNDEDPPERERLLSIMDDLKRRGYGWGDIAVLAWKNDQVVRATSWLNESGIPFISFSSLDVRSRRIALEMLALLGFLDSPPDDLSFATFLLGDIFIRVLASRGGPTPGTLRDFLFKARGDRPLYKAFQREFPALWKELFAGLFRSAGYLPLYDLVSDAYARFDVFSRAGEEEATLAKLLEAVKDFEGSGSNSLREFLGNAGTDGGEWAIDVPRTAPSVRAMTVHKAKGLGFPVVIALLYGDSSRGFQYTPLRENGGLALVRLNRTIAERDPSLGALYDGEASREKVNRLNALYVALTRAKREIYVIGVKRDRDAFPFDLLPVESFGPAEKKGKAAVEAGAPRAAARLSHDARPVPVFFGAARLGREELRRGELAHRMLALIGTAGADTEKELAAAAARAARETREDPAAARAIAAGLARMLQGELGACFRALPGRIVFTEKEFCDRSGRLVRMDRVIVDPGRVTVVDFKTGAPDPEAHEAQIRDYMRILSEVYVDRPVEALLAYVDQGTLRSIA